MIRKDINAEIGRIAANLLWQWSYDVDAYDLDEIVAHIISDEHKYLSDKDARFISLHFAIHGGNDLYRSLLELLGKEAYVELVEEAFDHALNIIDSEKDDYDKFAGFSTDELVRELVKRGSISE